MTVDMSPEAVALRLSQVSRLRKLCLSLARAGQRADLHPGVAGNGSPLSVPPAAADAQPSPSPD